MDKIMKEITGNVKGIEDNTHGWQNPHFPPEVRKACLQGKTVQMDEAGLIYYVISRWYERISGKRAPSNFKVYRNWKKVLRECLSGCWSEEEICWMIQAIEIGTHYRKERRDREMILEALKKCNAY